jgi:multidrug efflux system membrane fusion protein
MVAHRRWRWGLALPAVILVGLVIWLVMANHKPAVKDKVPTVSVSVAKVTLQDVPVSVSALGAAQAWQGVLIRAQVSGRLLSVPVSEGSYVSAGQVLAQIDPAPFRAALMQAQGALARDQALLANARIDLKRYDTLVSQDSISRQQRDTQAAVVKQDEGTVVLDQGAVASAEVNLRYCVIHSPVAGRVGVRLVDPGNLVSATDTTGIVTVNQVDPIAVTFTVPQGDFQRLADVSQGFTRPLPAEALSQETGASLGQGELSIADNHVDPSTGTVQLKARFPNPGKRLWPGQFVNVQLTLQTLAQAVVIPATAVNQGPSGAFVYVVAPGNKALMRPIKVTTTQGGVAVIASGLTPGEIVVTDGQMTLKPGSKVAGRGLPTAPKSPAARKPAA